MDWDLTNYFPQFNGPAMKSFKDNLREDISDLIKTASVLPPLSSENGNCWELVFIKYEDLLKRLSHIGSYVGCHAAADSQNEEYLREESELIMIRAESAKLRIELLKALKETSIQTFSQFINREALKGASHYLRRIREESQRTMGLDQERLAADLGVDGIQAWGRLYDTLSGKLEFEIENSSGTLERIPISQRRSLMENPDRQIRKAAFERGNDAWASVGDTAAAALNAISGTRLTLNRHRGIDHFLDVALFQSGITRKTLHAMLEAVYTELDLPRHILRIKASTMGAKSIAWYDLAAPLSLPDRKEFSWQEAVNLVKLSFDRAYPALGQFFWQIIHKRWVDWQPRPCKRSGGFCTSSQLINESRIFLTYNNAVGDVLTLAHESGHAFHSFIMGDLRPLARSYPMTLAESASTFGEMLMLEGLIQDPSISDSLKALLLDIEVGHAAVYLMDIPVRYEFEKSLYEEREVGKLSVSHLKDLMVETQQRVFGDVLAKGGEDPFFWASKLHFYITGITFYNFPYIFGFLLSRWLFRAFKKDGEEFFPRYEAFLRLSGSDTPENIVKNSFSCDLESTDFWVETIHSLDEPIQRLEALLPKVVVSSP